MLILTACSIGFITLTSLAVFFIYFKKKKSIKIIQKNIQKTESNSTEKSAVIITSQDIKAIAGDNIMATQLDLARAYIEIGKKRLAKKILDHVVEHGNSGQQLAAHQLMTTL